MIVKPCIERMPDGRGCAAYAEPGKSRCAIHERERSGNHPNRSPGTTTAWAKQRARVKRRDRHACRRCGVKERKINGRSNLQVHHVNGGGIDTPTADADLLTLCSRCHGVAQAELREQALRSSRIGQSRVARAESRTLRATRAALRD